MVMLSALERFRLRDENQRTARFLDLSIKLQDEDYPPVTSLLFRGQDRRKMTIPAEEILEIDTRSGVIRVANLDQGQAFAAGADTVWLKREVLDALVLDLQNRRAVRATDLWLEEIDRRWCLRAADASMRAVLRRLSRGWFKQNLPRARYDWKYVEFLRGKPGSVTSEAGYHLGIAGFLPGEIATLTRSLPYLHAAELITLLPNEKAADVLELLAPEKQLQVFEELDEDQALELLALMAPDVSAKLLGRLARNTARKLLNGLPPKKAERLIELLRYPTNSVGGVMTNDFVVAPADLSVAEARVTLREPLEEPDFVSLIYVVENLSSLKLCGVLSLRHLVTAKEDQSLRKLMDGYLYTLHPLEAATSAAYRLLDTHLPALPVVNDEGRMLGVMTVDTAVTQVAPAGWAAQSPRVFS